MKQFRDNVVIITGSSMGIGKALARQLLEQGAKVVINSRGSERLTQVAESLKAQGYDVLPVAGDVSKLEVCRDIVDRAINHYGQLDLLINNAGMNMRSRFEDVSPESLRLIMDTNYFGAVNMTYAALDALKRSKGGIVFVSSVAAFHGLPMHSLYSSSKIALQAFAESISTELKPYGLYVGIAYVGMTASESGKTIYNEKGEKVNVDNSARFNKLIKDKKNGVLAGIAQRISQLQPIDEVAEGIMDMVDKQKFKRTFTYLGKFHASLKRLSPTLVHQVIQKQYLRKGGW